MVARRTAVPDQASATSPALSSQADTQGVENDPHRRTLSAVLTSVVGNYMTEAIVPAAT